MAPEQGAYYFPETGHNLGGTFADFWEANGGLAVFGYPLSEVFEERLEDGQVHAVQYFERARFEVHCDEGRRVCTTLLGHLGRRVLAESRER